MGIVLNSKKYIEYFATKVIQLLKEKRYFYEGIRLKYMFTPCLKSEVLVVVFSACTRNGVKARYNYIRTLKGVEANCLFILDDFAEDSRGAYYLGKNCGNEIECAVKHLIDHIKESCGAKRIVFCGSSKGGWAALNLMTSFPGSIAVVGAPQYKLGNYLLAPALRNCMNYVMPNPTDDNVNYLNEYLKRKLQAASDQHHLVYLHYSDKEHTYDDHVRFLIDDLKEYGYEVVTECLNYTDHWDVSKYYPTFLIDCINRLI